MFGTGLAWSHRVDERAVSLAQNQRVKRNALTEPDAVAKMERGMGRRQNGCGFDGNLRPDRGGFDRQGRQVGNLQVIVVQRNQQRRLFDAARPDRLFRRLRHGCFLVRRGLLLGAAATARFGRGIGRLGSRWGQRANRRTAPAARQQQLNTARVDEQMAKGALHDAIMGHPASKSQLLECRSVPASQQACIRGCPTS